MPPRTSSRNWPAYSFDDRELRIRRNGFRMRIRGWEEPFAERRTAESAGWNVFSPEFRLVHPYRPKKKVASNSDGGQGNFDFFDSAMLTAPPTTQNEQKKRAFDRFRFSMPKEVGNAMEKFRSHQWPYLFLLRYDPGALDLAANNPVLAFFAAQRLNCDGELISKMQWCTLKQTEILGLNQFPATKNMVRLFRKICPQSVTGDNWHSIVTLLRRESGNPRSYLNHVPVINSGVVEILQNEAAAEVATPNLLEEVAMDSTERYRGKVVHLITSTLDMHQQLHTGSQIGKIQSVDHLHGVHEEVTAGYRRRLRQLEQANSEEVGNHWFRTPPLPGIPGKIEPITSADGLVNEGELQNNCVGSYASRVRSGTTYIYKVLDPERATLSLTRSDTDSLDWQISELEVRSNQPVSRVTEQFISDWLERHREILEAAA